MPPRRSQAVRTSMAAGEGPNEVDAYISSAPKRAQPMLREIRGIIKSTAPSAIEKISYGMPSYEYFGRLVYFAGHKSHVGVYGLVHVDSHVSDRLKKYLDHRSTLTFPLDGPLPVAAIRAAMRRRMKENESRHREAPRGGAAKR
jgi:uncharacterized protein YdhG (YjbR/CyaY superfamily)